MSANSSSVPQDNTDVSGKGKGKQVEDVQQHDMMDEDENESEDSEPEGHPEEPDEDNMEEIDPDNIIYSGRTRGKKIDWAEAEQKSKEAGDDLDDDDDDDDEDFEDPEHDEDRMEE